MAHLARCHCKRVYRCERAHVRRPGCFDSGDYHCDRCPDAGMPEHDLPPFNPTKMVFPVLKQVFPTLLASDIVSVQPMTAPLTIEALPHKTE